ncbi:Acyltransferase-like protein [Camellia lanceoleosa]|uniref:Acyltransferase-like protein n=1 Tax=Camellia lanceoleosa TaxID=1840588 RepID=A0ACC0I2P7_9ERIC|nr:Acyltransferase-like protein [Camellia lanceoleosa]
MAAATGAGLFSAVLSPAAGRFKFKRKVSVSATVTPTQPPAFTVSDNGRLHEATTVSKRSESSDAMPEDQRLSLKDYFELSKDMIRSDGGPPRWFSPFECGSRLNGSPLLLFLPGIDGVGLGLILQHQRLGEIFDIWCLHIPVMDRTPFADLVELVERTVRSENCSSPKRPIYLVGESVGACLALSVAARNPDIDLILILANPATSFSKSQLQPLIPLLQIIPEQMMQPLKPLLQIMPEQLHLTLPYILSLMTGIPLKMVMATVEKRLPLQETVGELSESVGALSSYLSVLADVLPRETLLWKLQMLSSASADSTTPPCCQSADTDTFQVLTLQLFPA